MHFDQKVNFRTQTDGQGYWNSKRKFVTINRIELASFDEDDQFGELRAYFDPVEWDIDEDGLIYSDSTWKYTFVQCMQTLGFSDDAILHIAYSEQGMQGNDYVSLDVGPDFVRECDALYRFAIHQQAVNQRSEA
jgi:hypothetical protein